MNTNTNTTNLLKEIYLTSEELDLKEKEFGFIWMAFFRYDEEEKMYICDGIKVDGVWKGKNSIFKTWKQADEYLQANGFKINYATSPIDGQALAVNMGVIAAYLRTKHPSYAERLAKQVKLQSLRFAKFNADGTGFVGYNPDLIKTEKRTFKIDSSWGASLIGKNGENSKSFVKVTGSRFNVRGDTVILEASPEKMESAEKELKRRFSLMNTSTEPDPSLSGNVQVSASPLTGWSEMAKKEASPLFEDFELPESVEPGKLIGPNGLHSKALSKHTGCKLEILENPTSGKPILRVHHSIADTRKSAHHTILAFLEYLDDSEKVSCPITIYSDAVSVPKEMVGHLIGVQGKNLRQLHQNSNCDFFYDKETGQFKISSFLESTLKNGVAQLQSQMKRVSNLLASNLPEASASS